MAATYLIDCDKCFAPAMLRCKTKSGRTTDTHAVRIARQFTTPDRITAIRRVVYDIYGASMALYAPYRINEKWDEWSQPGNRDELTMYLWMNSSGGGTAEYAAGKIRESVGSLGLLCI